MYFRDSKNDDKDKPKKLKPFPRMPKLLPRKRKQPLHRKRLK